MAATMAIAAAMEAQRKGKNRKPKAATRDDIKKAAIFRLAGK